MEKIIPTMCASMHRRDNHRHLTSNAGIPVESSLSGQHFAVMAWFWALASLAKMWTASHIFECTMNLLSLNLPFISTIRIGRECFEGSGGRWAQDGAPAHRLVAVRDRLNEVFGQNRVIALQYNVEWPPHRI